MIATKQWVKNLLSKVLKKTVNNYSLEEQKVGTWIDGKPIYQQTIKNTMPTVTTNGQFVSKSIDFNHNIDFVVKLEGILIDGSKLSIPLNVDVGNNTFNCIFYSVNENSINVRQNLITWNNCDMYITIQYTKTTDTATN